LPSRLQLLDLDQQYPQPVHRSATARSFRMANLHANVLRVGQPDRLTELFSMIMTGRPG
jgi:hypothetical protein